LGGETLLRLRKILRPGRRKIRGKGSKKDISTRLARGIKKPGPGGRSIEDDKIKYVRNPAGKSPFLLVSGVGVGLQRSRTNVIRDGIGEEFKREPGGVTVAG